MVLKRRGPPSLQSAIVQPDSPAADDRQGIIDAAYGCLSEPHSGPIPVAAILDRADLSTRAFYRHFASKDELFLAMLRQEADALADRLDGIASELQGDPVEQLTGWIETMFDLAHDPQLRMHLTVIDSDEVRAAKGYRETRERLHAARERSLEQVLERGRSDGSFPAGPPASGRRRHQRDRQSRAGLIGARQPRGSAAHAGTRTRLCAAGVGRSQISPMSVGWQRSYTRQRPVRVSGCSSPQARDPLDGGVTDRLDIGGLVAQRDHQRRLRHDRDQHAGQQLTPF